jgi:hypothetical protein
MVFVTGVFRIVLKVVAGELMNLSVFGMQIGYVNLLM